MATNLRIQVRALQQRMPIWDSRASLIGFLINAAKFDHAYTDSKPNTQKSPRGQASHLHVLESAVTGRTAFVNCSLLNSATEHLECLGA